MSANTANTVARLTPTGDLDRIRDPFSSHTETLRALRQSLLLRQTGESNVLTVVSPGAGEGKSRLAAELAWLFAQLGEPTLLVDANLRRPRQHLLFKGAQGLGLADALQAQSAPVLHAVEAAEALRLVTAGALPKHPVELLSAKGFGGLLASWRQQFRHIVIDTPAFAASSDALAVSVEAGAALMLVREHHSSMAGLRESAARLRAARVALTGTVTLAF